MRMKKPFKKLEWKWPLVFCWKAGITYIFNFWLPNIRGCPEMMSFYYNQCDVSFVWAAPNSIVQSPILKVGHLF